MPSVLFSLAVLFLLRFCQAAMETYETCLTEYGPRPATKILTEYFVLTLTNDVQKKTTITPLTTVTPLAKTVTSTSTLYITSVTSLPQVTTSMTTTELITDLVTSTYVATSVKEADITTTAIVDEAYPVSPGFVPAGQGFSSYNWVDRRANLYPIRVICGGAVDIINTNTMTITAKISTITAPTPPAITKVLVASLHTIQTSTPIPATNILTTSDTILLSTTFTSTTLTTSTSTSTATQTQYPDVSICDAEDDFLNNIGREDDIISFLLTGPQYPTVLANMTDRGTCCRACASDPECGIAVITTWSYCFLFPQGDACDPINVIAYYSTTPPANGESVPAQALINSNCGRWGPVPADLAGVGGNSFYYNPSVGLYGR